jgi:hypothetical protein
VAKSEFARVSQASGFYDVLDDYDVRFGTSAEDDSCRMTLGAEQARCLETYFALVTDYDVCQAAFRSLADTEGMRWYYGWKHDAGQQPSYAGPMWEPVPVEAEEDTGETETTPGDSLASKAYGGDLVFFMAMILRFFILWP